MIGGIRFQPSTARGKLFRYQGCNAINQLQRRESQPVFARYLNTSESTVQKWEPASKQPSGMALKLLAVVQKHGLDVLA
jgi:DNA-binding transcriptional regulator YiaG